MCTCGDNSKPRKKRLKRNQKRAAISFLLKKKSKVFFWFKEAKGNDLNNIGF
jgi:hypothetical protein